MKLLHYVGIDVSKAHLDFSIEKGKGCRIPNESTPITKLLKKLPANSCLIVESTGGYERKVIQIAHSLKLKWKVVNPARVRAFGISKGQLSKTDALDCQLLREFGERLDIQPDEGLDLSRAKLAELITTRDQLLSLKTQVTNFLEHAEGFAKKMFLDLKKQIVARIKNADAQILAFIKSSQLLAPYQALIAKKNMGAQGAPVLLAHLPELGQINRQQISCLVGLAPHPDDSGDFKGKRFIKGGRARVRKALYMCALSAITTNGPLRSFYRHLRSKGKLAKVALIAVARKFLIYLNSSFKNLPA